MHLLPEDDLISLNFYYRNKLKKSLTYLIFCGYFDKIRNLIENSGTTCKKKTKQAYESGGDESNSVLNFLNNQTNASNSFYQASSLNQLNEKIDINETDEWWIDLPSSIIKKTFNIKPYRPALNTFSSKESLQIGGINGRNTSNIQLRHSVNEAVLKGKSAIKTRGRTPLMLCSLIEDPAWSYSIAQNLIEKGADLALKDSNGYNALMYACLYEVTHIIELFLNAPSDYNLLNTDTYGNTVFIFYYDMKCFL